MGGLKIGIDAGHGGSDRGAISSYHGDTEAALNLNTAIALHGMLTVGSSFEPVLIRSYSADMSLARRAKRAHDAGAAIVLHVHHNANHSPTLHGLETYSWPGNDIGALYAEQIAASAPHELAPTRAFTSLPSWATDAKEVMRHFRATSILVECGYLTNEADSNWLHHCEAHRIIAASIYCGLARAQMLQA